MAGRLGERARGEGHGEWVGLKSPLDSRYSVARLCPLLFRYLREALMPDKMRIVYSLFS